MKVSALQLYLRSLQTALAATGVGSPLPEDLESAASGLDPFAGLDVGQLAAFLRLADEFRASGKVPVPPTLTPQAERVGGAVQELAGLAAAIAEPDAADQADFATRVARAQRDLEHALGELLRPLGVSVVLKGDPKALKVALTVAEARRTAGRARAVAAQLREALAGVGDEAALNAPERREKVAAITGSLGVPDLQAVAVEVGITKPPAKKEAILAAVLERLTGVKAASLAGKRAPKASAEAGHPDVGSLATRLKGLLEKAQGPEGLVSADVEAALAELTRLTAGQLKGVAQAAGLADAGKTKPDILKTIRLKLTEYRRALESIEV